MLALGLYVSQAVAQESPVVSIKEFMFVPMSTTIKAGSTVTWKNLDDEAHSIIAEGGLFRSDALDQNGTFSFRFDKPGVYKVVCGLHPNMKETITVE
ncbi:cupredoxin domain-containing protein [Bordetella sp. N]|uniref:cupredoxin domain-containing protein n=1 Tax=Bordetella sp. N TaxID=1746199 RepID=UPI001E439689|nr:cupredoxin domain-containing protein [Bordetella sp. N]